MFHTLALGKCRQLLNAASIGNVDRLLENSRSSGKMRWRCVLEPMLAEFVLVYSKATMYRLDRIHKAKQIDTSARACPG